MSTPAVPQPQPPTDLSWMNRPVTVPLALVLFMLGGGATFLGLPAVSKGDTITRDEVEELIAANDKLNEQRYGEILRRLDRMEATCK